MTPPVSPEDRLDNRTDAGQQFLTFHLREEEYGVDILCVQEIKGWDQVTQIPNMPEYVKGVINLRGAIIPLIDLRLRFGLEEVEYGPTTVVIVLKVESDGRERTFGIVVDAVSDVYDVTDDQLNPPPDLGSAINVNYVSGLAAVEEKMLILLDAERLVTDEALTRSVDPSEATV